MQRMHTNRNNELWLVTHIKILLIFHFRLGFFFLLVQISKQIHKIKKKTHFNEWMIFVIMKPI